MRPYSPDSPLNAFASALHPPEEGTTPSGQRLQLGLPGYLIQFAPLAFIPHRRVCSCDLPSPFVSPARINIFYHYPGRTGRISQPLAPQYLLLAARLSLAILQETYDAGYGCFRSNKRGSYLGRRDYRGGWHRSCPPLIRHTFYIWQKLPGKGSTPTRSVTLAGIAEVSRLLHPVGLGPVSQGPSGSTLSQGSYRS